MNPASLGTSPLLHFAGRPGHDFLAAIAASTARFNSAAHTYLADITSGLAPADAARRFSDVLRDEAAALFPLGTPATTWAQFLDAPALGPMRDQQLRWERTQAAAQETAQALQRLQRFWSDALHEAALLFVERLSQDRPSTPRALYDAWIDCAELAYARIAHGEPFCEALAEYINAESRWRNEFATIMELAAKSLGIPCRSEFDGLLQRLRDLEDRLTPQPRVQPHAAAARRASAPRTRAKPRPKR